MAVYVVSDLHGCFDEFKEMLKLIDFSEYDRLYIAGDICDRGKEPIALLRYIMAHENMEIIYGNHDEWLAKYIPNLIGGKKHPELLYFQTRTSDFSTWLNYNGGYITADQFLDLELPVCYDIEEYMDRNRVYYKELEVYGKKFLIVHSGLGSWCKAGVHIAEVPPYELIWPHIGIDDNPYEDVTMIVGHMPTFLYGSEYDGKILHGKKKSILHIDCGCVFGRTLGCVRLDDMQEFYVPSSYPRVV